MVEWLAMELHFPLLGLCSRDGGKELVKKLNEGVYKGSLYIEAVPVSTVIQHDQKNERHIFCS